MKKTALADKIARRAYLLSSPLDSRQMGKSGVMMPILGLGGQAALEKGTEDQAYRVFAKAVEVGIRYIDTAAAYGPSQERLGRFLRAVSPGVPLFVATKSVERKRDDFLRDLDRNTKLLGRVPDLMHVHAVGRREQGVILAKGGPLMAALKAKERGLCGMVGVTSHDDPDSLLEVLRWSQGIDVVMFAASAADARFLERVLPYCVQNGIATVAMKVMAKNQLIRRDGPAIRNGGEALRWVLSWRVSLAIVGFSFPEEVAELAMSCRNFEPMSRGEMQIVEDAVLPVSQDAWFYRSDVGRMENQIDVNPELGWSRDWPLKD